MGRLSFDPDREWELVKTLRERQFDAAIIFTSFSQTPHPAGYLCYLAGIPLRLGESKEWGGGVLTTEVVSAPDQTHQVERNLQLIEAAGFPVEDRSLQVEVSEATRQATTALLNQHGLSLQSPYLLLNPWASCQVCTYAWDRFAAAAQQLAETTGWPVVVTGVAKDRERSDDLLTIHGFEQAIFLLPLLLRLTGWRAPIATALRETRRWLDDAMVVVFFGFLHPVKGLEVLLSALVISKLTSTGISSTTRQTQI
ncbi:glycosyltransferase family 9 protein [Leptolyngbya sp. FACHB-261]|uniref:glycosyltransferase family 9 protein n=1 Tax=Leptolyngbya sp. FACHB-261 TaxID=2692806 RepID=UPI0018EFE330|nr:glycosyltransferase family 9 protein [Leptolyngbya sp. FACHB-261]